MYRELKNCLLCGKEELKEVIDLGVQYVVDFVKEKDESALKAPLVLMRCDGCNLVQLKHRVNPDRLYKKFWYRSGINEQMKEELLSIVIKACNSVDLRAGDKVLDIGCNDGTLLGCYNKTTTTIGIDPCADLVKEGMLNKKIDIGISDYFSANSVRDSIGMLGLKSNPKFKVITAIAMFYDVENPVGFLVDCKRLLDNEGVLIIQMNYLYTMLQDTAFDNICHEHLTYFSVSTLQKAVDAAGLDLQGIELSKCNGGSVRAYITHKGFDNFFVANHKEKVFLAGNASFRLIDEIKYGLHTDVPYGVFKDSVDRKVKSIRDYVSTVPAGKLYGYGASTRGTVTLQYVFKDVECPLVAVAERDENKFGLKMVGTWTPIIDEVTARKNASHMFVLPWHFEKSIIKREDDWINSTKGTLIFPLPQPHLAECMDEPLVSSVRAI